MQSESLHDLFGPFSCLEPAYGADRNFRASETLEAFDAKSFVTFLTSIMIALLIEALLSVFKASLSQFSDLLYVSALIVLLALLFLVVKHFIRGSVSGHRRGTGSRCTAGTKKMPRRVWIPRRKAGR